MRKLTKILVIAALMLPSAAWAQTIMTSRHNLAAGSTDPSSINGTSAQVCIYCHTPHKAQTTQVLWNHLPTTNAAWNWGTDLDLNPVNSTVEGTPLPNVINGGSRRCLGCHDGSVAIGDVSNAGNGMAGNVGPALIVAASAYNVGAGGNMGGNHPVSIPYAGATYFGVTSGAVGDGSAGNYYEVMDNAATCTSPTGICVNLAPAGELDGYAINLYSDGTGGYGVECGSCHEPHNRYGFAYLTRVDVAAASGLCRSCHNK